MQLANSIKYAASIGLIKNPINEDVRQAKIIHFDKVNFDVTHLKCKECVVRLPFEDCLINFENQLCVFAKEACSTEKDELGRELFVINFFMFFPVKEGFCIYPFKFYFFVTKEGLIVRDLFGQKGNIYIKALQDVRADETDIQWTIEASVLCRTHLTLLNCKNVSLERKEQASDRINQRRIRKNKRPLYSYYVANIGKNSIHFKSSGVKTGDHYRFHICRGHLKHRRTGTFWWSHHTRGHKDLGVIVKDYKVEDINAKDVIPHVAEV